MGRWVSTTSANSRSITATQHNSTQFKCQHSSDHHSVVVDGSLPTAQRGQPDDWSTAIPSRPIGAL